MVVGTETSTTPSFLRMLPLARRAFRLAREAHGEQRRESDAAPFIVHPLEVAALLHHTGHADHVVAAAILHDTVEDTAMDLETIRTEFGREIARLVAAMTEDPVIESFEDRKAALRRQIAGFGEDAAAIYAADKVAKVRELRSRATRDEAVLDAEHAPTRDTLDHYAASLEMLEGVAQHHPLVRQLRFELEVLLALPPRPDLLMARSDG
jgi:(p)ppGpp synthase/HD superfamily hydrolase